MSDEADRTKSGQFQKGTSGNPEGARSRKRRELLTREDFHRTVLEIAALPTEQTIPGRSRTASLFEVNVFSSALGKARQPAMGGFIELVKDAVNFFDTRERSDKLNRRTPNA